MIINESANNLDLEGTDSLLVKFVYVFTLIALVYSLLLIGWGIFWRVIMEVPYIRQFLWYDAYLGEFGSQTAIAFYAPAFNLYQKLRSAGEVSLITGIALFILSFAFRIFLNLQQNPNYLTTLPGTIIELFRKFSVYVFGPLGFLFIVVCTIHFFFIIFLTGVIFVIIALIAARQALADVWKGIKESTKNPTPYILLLPAFLALFVMIIIPLVVTLSYSVLNIKGSYPNYSYEFTGLSHFFAVLTDDPKMNPIDPYFWSIFINSVVWTVINVSFHITIGLILALIVNQDFKGKNIYKILILIPWALPQFIGVITWRYFIFGAIRGITGYPGVANTLLIDILGLDAWFPDVLTTNGFIFLSDDLFLSSAILVNIWLGYPFMMVMFVAALQSIPESLYDASIIDGASWFTRLKTITLPGIKKTFISASTLGLIWTFNMFTVIYILSPPNSVSTPISTENRDILTTFIFNQDPGKLIDQPLIATYAFLNILILGIFIFYYLQILGKDEIVGGEKIVDKPKEDLLKETLDNYMSTQDSNSSENSKGLIEEVE